MGISAKWLKSLVGLKKQERSQNSEDNGNKKVPTSRFWHGRRQSVDLDDAIREDEFVVGTAPSTEEPDIQLSSNSASTTSLHVQVSYQTEQNLKEEWAATVIQTAFRAFLVLQQAIALPTGMQQTGLLMHRSLSKKRTDQKQNAASLLQTPFQKELGSRHEKPVYHSNGSLRPGFRMLNVMSSCIVHRKCPIFYYRKSK